MFCFLWHDLAFVVWGLSGLGSAAACVVGLGRIALYIPVFRLVGFHVMIRPSCVVLCVFFSVCCHGWVCRILG